MPTAHFTRRALLAGAGATVSSAALAVPYVRAADLASDPMERAKHHFAEMAKALDELSSDAHGWIMNAGCRGERILNSQGSDLPWGNVQKVRLVEELIMPDGRPVWTTIRGVRQERTHMLVTRYEKLAPIGSDPLQLSGWMD